MKQILFLVAMCITNLIYCQQGFVDTSFGNNGFISGSMPGQVNSIIQQQDGKLLAAGDFDLKYSIARFLNNGTLDSSFGINGFTVSNPVGGAYDMLLNANKEILISGSYVDENNISQYFVSRFKTNGKPDSSFGVNGTTVIPKAHRADVYTQIALNTDGSIIVGGFGTNSVITLDSQYSIISKLSPDGIFDNAFGNSGYTLNLNCINMKDLAIQSDGDIVTVGYNFGLDFVASRYNSDGSLDKSFGKDGNETFVIGGDDELQKIIIQADGKLMIGGFTNLKGNKMCALRLNADGSLDNSFADSGEVLINFPDSSSVAYDMVQQADGKFILAGGAIDLKQTGGSFALCRITNDGKLDSSFGINGLQTTAYSYNAGAYCAALQSDGKIVLGGYYQEKNSDPSYLIARYDNKFNQKQILITKIRHWIQHHNGFTWNANSNVSSYVVQRSYDGIHFSSIARINANNSSNYTYADPSPLSGNNTYRLQTISINGVANYSNVIEVTNSYIKISPNPAINSLHIEGLPSSNIKLIVVDFAGNIALSVQLSAFSASSYNLNIASLKPGNYLLKIDTNDDVVTKKFVKE